ncbi:MULTISPECIES: SRPBCC family protein [Pseudomonas aeruginosa group]|uniref:SRPBCC family protein n=1 Tax=Pseudomonas aeruginosa group TaxID=136841 RepID=UPI00071B137D|nr:MULTISPECIES: SRPBCC family protein [Pseudomonas aeruginosa group]AVR69320.1 polyketide cyclase [Pseudomonas paraeruginosa]KSP93695.1 polyketide cyclase [Pseudomonas aeruginosa]KSR47376.1 polyketide cyclase [Pseudomonas aeruginosa]MBG3905333.1 SRPBCC family protein [Pseudomonas aeruginosa]MBG4203569.1 SRPBCC family protein [Pseudomonas aeruginosa]
MTAAAQVVAKAEMLIRRPIAEVFEAFVDPAITARFWFSRGDARLEAGKRLRWHWDMYGVSQEIEVKDLQTNRRILIEWPNGDSNPSLVEWLFEELPGAGTFVSIRNSGFVGTPEEVIPRVVDATEGFTLVLAGLKACLEHGIALNLVADRFPRGLDG